VCGIPGPGVRVLGGDENVFRAGVVGEILEAPGIGFADGHDVSGLGGLTAFARAVPIG